MAELPRLRHLVLPSTLPYAELADPGAELPAGPLTDEPGTALVAAARIGSRLSAGGADHLTGYGARQVLDGHPARLADLVRAGRARRLAAPGGALSRAGRAAAPRVLDTPRAPPPVWAAPPPGCGTAPRPGWGPWAGPDGPAGWPPRWPR
ncbi:hypothetical protein GCM10009664_74040 [Kitasatospora gansuensis]